MFEIQQLDHLVLRATDCQALVDFYCEVLGMKVERTVESVGLVQLRAGASLIDIVDSKGVLGKRRGVPPDRNNGTNLDHFCLRIEPFDAEAIRAHLKSHGVDTGDVQTVYGAEGYGSSIYLDDPEGNTIELKGPAHS
ncbi:MAG: VOC family protein [Gammaproteobacteria bacterium]|nr:VOC family protein [Gammaproteobacteria bacterium]